LNLPTAHEVQAFLPASETVPVEQELQEVTAVPAAYFPEAHAEHTLEPAAFWNVPAAHAEHALAAALL